MEENYENKENVSEAVRDLRKYMVVQYNIDRNQQLLL